MQVRGFAEISASKKMKGSLRTLVSFEQVVVSAAPVDPFQAVVQSAVDLPGQLRLPTICGELPGSVQSHLLLVDYFVDQAVGRGQPVGLGEQFKTSPAV